MLLTEEPLLPAQLLSLAFFSEVEPIQMADSEEPSLTPASALLMLKILGARASPSDTWA